MSFTFLMVYISMGIVVAQWLRCRATNRKDAGSIPDGVITTNPGPFSYNLGTLTSWNPQGNSGL